MRRTDKKVLIPCPEAGCSLAESCDAAEFAAFKARYAVAPLPEARAADAPVLGLRRTAAGDSALVPSDAGIGHPATLEDIMTHLPKEDVA